MLPPPNFPPLSRTLFRVPDFSGLAASFTVPGAGENALNHGFHGTVVSTGHSDDS